MLSLLPHVSRLDLVLDVYTPESLKAVTRRKRKKVSGDEWKLQYILDEI